MPAQHVLLKSASSALTCISPIMLNPPGPVNKRNSFTSRYLPCAQGEPDQACSERKRIGISNWIHPLCSAWVRVWRKRKQCESIPVDNIISLEGKGIFHSAKSQLPRLRSKAIKILDEPSNNLPIAQSKVDTPSHHPSRHRQDMTQVYRLICAHS